VRHTTLQFVFAGVVTYIAAVVLGMIGAVRLVQTFLTPAGKRDAPRHTLVGVR
jgi:hypothetical protein